MPTFRLLGLLLINSLLLASCSQSDTAEIKGQIDYIGSSTIYLEKKPVHYKYADKIRYDIDPDNRGRFSLKVETDTLDVLFFTIDDKQYPLIVKPNTTLDIRIHREYFPDSVSVEGYEEPWDEYFSSYWKEETYIQQRIDEQMPDFRDGERTDIRDLFKHRYVIAKRYLGDTPLEIYYYRNIGEYLVKKLEHITYNRDERRLNPQKERKRVIRRAKRLDFFSFESLKAQRAGIRDFTNAYANTFGVADSLEEEYGQELTQYDVKRLGYERLNETRVSVLEHIEERRALAYAKMHLIAERIGEMSPEVAESSYRAFLEEYEDFPEYTSFLQSFYERVQRVTPGQPAVPFSLPNQYSQTVSMEDMEGKYVLLDFWASWCIPCLDEFPHMRELYRRYSRDDFEILAISIEEDSLRWRQAINQFKNPWPQLYGGNGFQQETFSAYQGGGIPFYILIDREGNILRHNDIRPSFNLPQLLDSLITEE